MSIINDSKPQIPAFVEEKVFKQDVDDFAAMLGADLDKRNSQIASKYAFDFNSEQPFGDSQTLAGGSSFSWSLKKTQSTPLDEEKSVSLVETKPRMKLTIPKIQQDVRFSCLKPGNQNMYDRQSNVSLFGRTDSTAASSMCDLNGTMSDVSNFMRTSIVPKMRRTTVPNKLSVNMLCPEERINEHEEDILSQDSLN